VTSTPGAYKDTHLGFDNYPVPTRGLMQTWMTYSPFYDYGVDLPNAANRKTNTGLSPGWVTDVEGYGWGLIPFWAGPQSPCADNKSRFVLIDTTKPAYPQGQADANKTAAELNSLGGNLLTVYYDMENYTTSSGPPTACQTTVRQFLNGWINGMHSQGFTKVGIYGNVAPAAYDFSQLSPLPDDVWITQVPVSTAPPSVTTLSLASKYVSLCDQYTAPPCNPPLWESDQRIHQYLADETEFWGGASTAIDADVVDADVGHATSGTKAYTFSFTPFFPDGTITSPLSINNIGTADGNYGGFINGSNSDLPGSIGQILDNWQLWINNVFEGQGNGLYNPDTKAFNLLPNYDPAGQCGNNAYCTTVMSGMNNAGQTVGSWTDSNNKIRGFVYSGGLNGSFTSFDYSGATSVFPTAINDAGLVVGYYTDSIASHGFLYNAKTQLFVTVPLDPPGATGTQLLGLNGYAQIAGTYSDSANNIHGFVYSNGNFVNIDCGVITVAQGINNNGEIVGNYDLGMFFQPQGFTWNNAVQVCNNLTYPNSFDTQPLSINDAGQISGEWNVGGTSANGFVAVPQTP
jgi:hypothetical protein